MKLETIRTIDIDIEILNHDILQRMGINDFMYNIDIFGKQYGDDIDLDKLIINWSCLELKRNKTFNCKRKSEKAIMNEIKAYLFGLASGLSAIY